MSDDNNDDESIFDVLKRGRSIPAVQASEAPTASVKFSANFGEPPPRLTDDEKAVEAVAAVKRGATVTSTTNSINAMQSRLEWIEQELKPFEFDSRTGQPVYRRDEHNRANLEREAGLLRDELETATLTLHVAQHYEAEAQQQQRDRLELDAAKEEFIGGDPEMRELLEKELKQQKAAHFAAWLIDKTYTPPNKPKPGDKPKPKG